MNNKITYHREGDYFIPDLCLPKQPNGHIGKYGRLRLNYLKNFDIPFYTELLISGTLKQYLLDIDRDASNKVNSLIKGFAEDENVNELLKEHHQMEWVQAMNNLKNKAEEIVLNEIIYVQEVLDMVNFREVNDDILKEWFNFREETYLCYADKQDRENEFKFDVFRDNILKNIPKQNRTYVEKQLDLLYDDFMRYLTYITEKYYRNGFVDGSQLVMGCFDE